MPNCPSGTVTKGSCQSASCTTPNPPDPNSVCTGAQARNVNTLGQQCTTTGMTDSSGCALGTERCQVNKRGIMIQKAATCKVGESLCPLSQQPRGQTCE